MTNLVSVIITTKNEEKNIENCLKSILQQSYSCDKIEIIVVDNNSTDRTKEIVKEFEERFTPLNVQLFNKGPERSAQKNFGLLEKAKGKYLMHLDADMILDKNVIAECVETMENNKELIGLYIPEIVMGDKFFSKVRRFERSFYNATVIDGLRFFTKEAALKIKGFDENLYACEDWDFDKRIKNLGKTGIIKDPIYHNETEFDLRKYISKKAYYSKNFNRYLDKWGKNDPDIKKQFGFYYRFLGVFVENRKWKKLISHPILTFGMYFLRFLVGFNYLIRKK